MPDDLLVVTGAVARTLNLTPDDLRANYPRAEIDTTFETDNGLIDAAFVGARLWDVMTSAGLQLAGSFYVEASAPDGWMVTVRRDEVDPALTGRTVLIAYGRDGGELPPRDRPLRLVVPGDGPGRRFVRGLAVVTVIAGDPPAEA